MGSIYQRGELWWLKYRDRTGRVIRQSSGLSDKADAAQLLKIREGRVEEGHAVLPRADKITVRELTDALVAEYKANERRSAPRLATSLAHLLPYFGAQRAATVTTDHINTYIGERRDAGAANATINRELAALKRAFKLAVNGELIVKAPHINMLIERNTRRGFFEPEQFLAVLQHLPDYAKAATAFAYITGWRVRSEILTLQWHQVDFEAHTVSLEPGTTKSRAFRGWSVPRP